MKIAMRAAGLQLAAKLVNTYHISWLTYPYVRDRGQVGLEDVFEAAYGKPMEMLESPNDTSYSFDLSRLEPLDKYDQYALNRCIESGTFQNYRLRTLLQDLIVKGVLPAGHYVVTVSW